MRVKCRYCGERVEKEDAYKDPNKNSYYCSEEHYLATMKKREDFQKEKEEKKQNKIDPVYEEVADIFDCTSKSIRNYLKSFGIPIRANGEAVKLESSK